MTFSCWTLRILIIGIILASALGKSLDLAGFVAVLATYRAVPLDWLWPLAWSVIGIEWALALWLLSGWNLGTGALACAGLNLGYAAWMTISLLRGLDIPNCGCFGRFFPQPLRCYSPFEDLVLVGMSYAPMALYEKTARPTDTIYPQFPTFGMSVSRCDEEKWSGVSRRGITRRRARLAQRIPHAGK
ncbi:MAG TPA: MauE/DoxX family redox-associated membrane protein [Nitrospiraceae bacterium]|nr:MauE/DoxX family redox-associated membrane protein [Nitrospiraceae bacterium]